MNLEQACPDIDRNRQDRRVEEERENGVAEHEPPHARRRDRDVGRLHGRADGEREIQEVPIVRVATARELQPLPPAVERRSSRAP